MKEVGVALLSPGHRSEEEDDQRSWKIEDKIDCFDLRDSFSPAKDTEVRIAPRVILVSFSISSFPLNKRKAMRFPMKPEDMFMAQNMPEFLVMVSGSELFASRNPWRQSKAV